MDANKVEIEAIISSVKITSKIVDGKVDLQFEIPSKGEVILADSLEYFKNEVDTKIEEDSTNLTPEETVVFTISGWRNGSPFIRSYESTSQKKTSFTAMFGEI